MQLVRLFCYRLPHDVLGRLQAGSKQLWVQTSGAKLGARQRAAKRVAVKVRVWTRLGSRDGKTVTLGDMERLVARIAAEGKALPGSILKVDGFINHRLEPDLTLELGRAFAERFAATGVSNVDKIVTAEVSGIAPALATGVALGVPVVYARKKRPVTMPDALSASAPSRTKGGVTPLYLSPEYVTAGDRVLLIDDFLASGETILALAELIRRCGAELLGVGCVVEKTFQGGRKALSSLGVPVVSLAAVTYLDEAGFRVENGR